MAKFTIKQLQAKLQKLGILNEDNEPILYSAFKNRASIHKYRAREGVLKIVFVGHPKENLFGFYASFANDNDVNVMREAYKNLKLIASGKLEPHENDEVQWGNCGIPLAYGKLRTR